MNKKLVTTLSMITLVTTSAFINPANAHDYSKDNNCNLELNYDLSISPEHIRIIEDDETMVDIFNDKVVFIKGEQIELNSQQQTLITNYSTSIRNAIPEVTQLALEAVDVAFEAISTVMGNLGAKNNTEEKFTELKEKLVAEVEEQNGHYSVTKGDFNMNIDDQEIDQMVEDIVEEMLPSLIGGILANLGTALMNGDTDFESLENLGEEIEQEMESKTQDLENRATLFCESMKSVDELESEIVGLNKKFQYFDLINVED